VDNLSEFTKCLDENLQKFNTYYKDLIDGNVLKQLQITVLEKDAFRKYMKSVGKLGGQNKVPRLANDRKIAVELLKFKL
jgi:hypothetical protein